MVKEIPQQIVKTLTFPKAYLATLEKFLQLIERDKNVLTRILPRYKKHGPFSPAIQMLIQFYVDKNWPAFVQAQAKAVEKREVMANAQT